MTAKLPAGIITNSDSITGNIEQIVTVDAEDIARLWRGMSMTRPSTRWIYS